MTNLCMEVSATSRVITALRDHTLLPVIAAHAELSETECAVILKELARQGLAENYTADCWGLR